MVNYLKTHALVILIFALSACSHTPQDQIFIQEVIPFQNPYEDIQSEVFKAFLVTNNTDQAVYYRRTVDYKLTSPSSRLDFEEGESIQSIICGRWTEHESIVIQPGKSDTIMTLLQYNTRNEDSSRIGFRFYDVVDSNEREYFISLTNLRYQEHLPPLAGVKK